MTPALTCLVSVDLPGHHSPDGAARSSKGQGQLPRRRPSSHNPRLHTHSRHNTQGPPENATSAIPGETGGEWGLPGGPGAITTSSVSVCKSSTT